MGMEKPGLDRAISPQMYILKKFSMENSKQISTPVDVNDKLLAASGDSE